MSIRLCARPACPPPFHEQCGGSVVLYGVAAISHRMDVCVIDVPVDIVPKSDATFAAGLLIKRELFVAVLCLCVCVRFGNLNNIYSRVWAI